LRCRAPPPGPPWDFYQGERDIFTKAKGESGVIFE
jgi:hypothetical protein